MFSATKEFAPKAGITPSTVKSPSYIGGGSGAYILVYWTWASFNWPMFIPDSATTAFACYTYSSQGLQALVSPQFTKADGSVVTFTSIGTINTWTLYQLNNPPKGPVIFNAGAYGMGYTGCAAAVWLYEGVKTVGALQTLSEPSATLAHSAGTVPKGQRAMHWVANGNLITNYDQSLRMQLTTALNGTDLAVGDAAGDGLPITFGAKSVSAGFSSAILPLNG